MSDKKEILNKCYVKGNIIKLPDEQLDRKLYLDIKKSLELIGGKWKGGKILGFVFPYDPTELLKKIAGGENINLKKQYQFFATPDDLADVLVHHADLKETDEILEPSAGQGAIVNAINRVLPDNRVFAYELMDINRTFLEKNKLVLIKGWDFLDREGFSLYDKIIANPPFSKNQDVTHILEMYRCLKLGGRLVTIASKHWENSEFKKELAFKEWLKDVDAEIIEIPEDTFKSSGTSVGGNIIIINK